MGVIDKKSDTEVKTSCNLSVIQLNEGNLHCDAMLRSSDNNVIMEKSNEISNFLKSKKIQTNINDKNITLAWEPTESSLSKMYTKSMKDVCNISPVTSSIHAGLETSSFVQKNQIYNVSVLVETLKMNICQQKPYTQNPFLLLLFQLSIF